MLDYQAPGREEGPVPGGIVPLSAYPPSEEPSGPGEPDITTFIRMLPAALAVRRDFPALAEALDSSLAETFGAVVGYYSHRGPYAGQVFCGSGMDSTEYARAVGLVYSAARKAFDSLAGEPLQENSPGLPVKVDQDATRAAFLWFDESRSGAFVFLRAEPAFSADEIKTAAICAAVAAEVIALGADIVVLEAETKHDFLTGLLNRSFFEQALPAEIERARRFSGHFSLVLMDLDNFKRFNDTFGHSRGDEFLKLVGVALGETLRRADTAMRYGGDEFALILPNTLPKDVTTTLVRVRERIEGIGATLGAEMNVSASFGLVHFPTDAQAARQLVAIADSRLYHAKRQGDHRDPGRASGGQQRTQNTTSEP